MQIGVAYVQALLQNKELTKAESMLEQLTVADPENASVRVLKAQIASAGGDRSGAIDEIKQAIEAVDPQCFYSDSEICQPVAWRKWELENLIELFW